MSYDIFYIKKNDLEIEDVDELLEADVTATDEHYISKALMQEITLKLKSKGLEFESIEDEDSIELNFASFQVSLYLSQVGISLPYWEVNNSDEVGEIVNTIILILEESGMKGYDPQAECIYDEDFDFMEVFSISQDLVANKLIELDTEKKWWQFWK